MRTVEKPFEIIDHTADIGIVAYGTDVKQIFANAAFGLFSLMADLDEFKGNIQRKLQLSADDMEFLLVAWLNELIYVFDVEHIIFKRFEVDELTSTNIKARCFGDKIKLGQHKLKREIKAATYHMLKIDKGDGGYKAQVIFDI